MDLDIISYSYMKGGLTQVLFPPDTWTGQFGYKTDTKQKKKFYSMTLMTIVNKDQLTTGSGNVQKVLCAFYFTLLH